MSDTNPYSHEPDEQKEQPMTSQPTYQPPTYQPSSEPSTPPAPPPAFGQPAQRRLVRSRDDRWLGGVCGGVAEYAGIDATLVRVLVVLGTVLGLGSLVLVYLAAWILMPQE